MTPGNELYTIVYAQQVVKEDIPKLPKSIKPLIKRVIEERIATNPIHYGTPLRYSLASHRRVRVSDYRIIYRIAEEEKIIYIVAIQHRKEVYKNKN